jgi:hypothetical protein
LGPPRQASECAEQRRDASMCQRSTLLPDIPPCFEINVTGAGCDARPRVILSKKAPGLHSREQPRGRRAIPNPTASTRKALSHPGGRNPNRENHPWSKVDLFLVQSEDTPLLRPAICRRASTIRPGKASHAAARSPARIGQPRTYCFAGRARRQQISRPKARLQAQSAWRPCAAKQHLFA